jgi:uncharacterized protein (DUF58 family)
MNAIKLLLLLLGVLVIGQVTDWPVADTLALALGGVLVLAFTWSRLSLQGVSGERLLSSDRSQVGETVRETIRLRNSGLLGKLWVEAVDHSSLPGHDPGRVVRLPGRGAADWTASTPCVRRGRYRLGPMTLRAGDPLGLFPTRLALPWTHEVVIYPPTVPLRDAPSPVAALDGGATRDRKTPQTTPSIAGIRDYAPGDAYNRIAWGQTARRGRLMVKEFDLDQTADVWLVIDLEATAHRPATRPMPFAPDARGRWPVEAWLDSTLELAVAATASLARRFLDEGRSVGLIATGAHLETIQPDRGPRQLTKLLEALAVVAADGHMPLAEVLMAEARRFGRSTGLVIVSPSADDRWAGALAEIAGRRVRATAVVVEADTFAPAPSVLLAVGGLAAASIPVHLLKYGEPLAVALAGAARGLPIRSGRR